MAKKKAEGFEAHLEALERIVEELEAGELPLEESLERYKDGVTRLKSCYGLLREAEKSVKKLVRGADGALTEEPFESGDA